MGKRSGQWCICLSLGQELAVCFACSLRPQAGYFLSTGSCIRNSNRAAQNSDLRQGSKYGRAQILSFEYQKRLSEVSAGSECRPRGELTLDWNGSLHGAPHPHLLPSYDLCCQSQSTEACRPGNKIPQRTFQLDPFCSGTLLGRQIRGSTDLKGFSQKRPKASIQTKSPYSFILLVSSAPLIFLIDVVNYFSNSYIEKLVRICNATINRLRERKVISPGNGKEKPACSLQLILDGWSGTRVCLEVGEGISI